MENILDKESVRRVIKILDEFDPSLKVEILNSSARTAEDAASSLNCEVGAIVKSLLLRTENDFILCLVSGDNRCSLNKVKKIIIFVLNSSTFKKKYELLNENNGKCQRYNEYEIRPKKTTNFNLKKYS